jgi:hypothetical protein
METRFDEERYVTSDLKEMLNKFTAKRVLRTWKEDFVDQDNGEVATIERNEVLVPRGTLLDREMLAMVQFYMESGEITEVEVTNQRRMGMPQKNNWLYPFLAVVSIADKNRKVLFYAVDVPNGLLVLSDFLELNTVGMFRIAQVKEFNTDIVLIDSLKKYAVDEDTEKEPAEDETEPEMKWYQIEFNVDVDGVREHTGTAVVKTFNTDQAMMLIGDYLLKKERESVVRAARQEHRAYEPRELVATLETSKILKVDMFIPQEFSMAYGSDLT